MRETKRRLETFSLYDRTGLEAHLTRMAEQGWLLDKIGPFFWTYRKIEPKRLTFSVTYFPKASQFDPGPSEEQQTFYDLCAHSGWVLAAASAQLQVFYSEEPDPVPIDTDPALEVETIHRTMKKSLIPSQLALLALAVFQFVMFVWRAVDDPIGTLASPSVQLAALSWVLLLLLVGVELSSYFRWHRKAVLAAEHGEFLATRSHRKLQIGALVFLGAEVAWFILSMAASGNQMVIVLTVILFLVYVPGLFLVIRGVSGWLKRQETPAKLNMVVTFIALAVAAYAFLGVIIFGVIFGHDRGWWREDGGQDRPPLVVEDLLDPGYDGYELRYAWEETLLLGRAYMQQDPPTSLLKEDRARYLALPSIRYTVVRVRAPFLYERCLDSLRYDNDDREDDQVPEGCKRYYEPCDPAPWGAKKAYRWIIQGLGPSDLYLLCYPDRIVEVGFSWAPTPEQIARAGETLGRGKLP